MLKFKVNAGRLGLRARIALHKVFDLSYWLM